MTQAPRASATPVLSALQAAVTGEVPPADVLEGWLAGLVQEGTAEHALALSRPRAGDPAWDDFRRRLKAQVAANRGRRMAGWQNDPRRRKVRVRFSVDAPASDLHPPALLASLARAFLDAGLPLAMGLEKVPRPALVLGHPLPQGVAGRGEWVDVGLDREPGVPLGELPALLDAHAPAGVAFLDAALVPTYASPVADLCRSALWRWACPGPEREAAERRTGAFLAAESFAMEKAGKTGGQKGLKRVEIRSLVEDMAWADGGLVFRTAIRQGQALNPRKLLAAILGREPAEVLGLERLELALDEDPRLLEAERYAPKLHNMFEDAVLLESGPNIRIVDEDDDEPIRLHD